jgi:hypothetical protein
MGGNLSIKATDRVTTPGKIGVVPWRYPGSSGTAMPPLLPLRIPAGWAIKHNDLREADVSPLSIDAGLFHGDLLELKHLSTGILVHIGWHGDAKSGRFAIYTESDSSRMCFHEFHSRDRLSFTAEIERALRLLS